MNPLLIAFSGLVIPIILIINSIILIYWIITKRWWAIIPILSIAINIGYLTSIFQVTIFSPQVPNNKQIIHIASYNVGKFKSWEHFEPQHYISEYFKKNNTNIICFQEYRENDEINADTLSRLLNCLYHAITYLPGSTV